MAALYSCYTLLLLCCRSTQEMEQAVEAVQCKVQTQQLRPEDVTPATLEAHLYTQVLAVCCSCCPATLAHIVERAAEQLPISLRGCLKGNGQLLRVWQQGFYLARANQLQRASASPDDGVHCMERRCGPAAAAARCYLAPY